MVFLPDTKKCGKCFKTKIKSEFYLNPNVTDGLNSYCKICAKLQNKKYWRNQHLYRNFGITEAQYKMMLKSQKGVCAICGQFETIKYKNKLKQLAVDHHHSTGKIRGLLCDKCNLFLAHVENNPQILKVIPKYLERNIT